MDNSDESKKNFFKYVFNFNDEGKADILNLLQYFFISIIPVILLVKLIDKYVPPNDETKSSLEIGAEVFVEIVILVIGLFFINRIAIFFPTYSGENYPKINIITGGLAILLTIISLNPVIAGKINILLVRLNNVWEGKTSETKNKSKTVNVNGKQLNVKVTQPFSSSQSQSTSQSNSNYIPQYNDSTSINQLPTNDSAQNYALSPQSLPNYNAMYKKDNTPLVDASTPGQPDNFIQEPMAANDALGSWGGFSSW